MISFISWVNNQEQYKGFQASAKGIDCEFIEVGQDCKSLAEAYNVGTEEAIGDILIYVHQDVRIRDNRFQELVEKALEDEKTGFAGVIGNTVPGVENGMWWNVPDTFKRGWLLQGNRLDSFGGAYDGPARQLDGLMLCTKKRFWWPEQYPGIHYVDLHMCRVAERQGLTNRIFSVCIQHLSQGDPNPENYEPNRAIYAQA